MQRNTTTTARTFSSLSHHQYTWLTLHSEANYIIRADATLTGFFTACASNPSSCAIAHANKTGAQLESEFYNWLYHLKYLPLGDNLTTLIRYSDVKASVRNILYSPSTWSNFSSTLQALYNGNVTAALLTLSRATTNLNAGVVASSTDTSLAIRGVDKSVRRHTLSAMTPYITKILQSSQSIGDVSAFVTMVVAQWKIRAKEVYTGNFKVKTRNPVLLASNSWDPVAPLEAAEKLGGLLEGSRVLVNNGYGVSWLSSKGCWYGV
jgi:hypothetical protein